MPLGWVGEHGPMATAQWSEPPARAADSARGPDPARAAQEARGRDVVRGPESAWTADPVRAELALIARDGIFPTSRAVAAGIGRTRLRQLVRQGRCHPLHRGWYSLEQPGDAPDVHRLRTRALLAEHAGAVVASHGSAVLLLGLPTLDLDLTDVHLMWRDPRRGFQRGAASRIHELTEVTGLPMGPASVHPALACLQVGQADARALMVAADGALRAALATRQQLRDGCAALRGRRGVAPLARVIEWCDERHESAGESLTAYVLRSLGYDLVPQFEPGTVGPGGHPERCDFGIRGTSVLVEFDGLVKYGSTGSAPGRALFAEKRREDGIRELGFEVVRLTWADLHRPEVVRARVEAAITRGRARLDARTGR